MSETKCTPGPWKALDDGSCVIDNRGLMICDMGFVGVGPESHANARLIAESPTMYEYISDKAKRGDETAKQIISNIAEAEPTKEVQK